MFIAYRNRLHIQFTLDRTKYFLNPMDKTEKTLRYSIKNVLKVERKKLQYSTIKSHLRD